MPIQTIDVKCECERLPDGKCIMIFTISGVTDAQAEQLSAAMRDVTQAVLSEGAAGMVTRDLSKPLS